MNTEKMREVLEKIDLCLSQGNQHQARVEVKKALRSAYLTQTPEPARVGGVPEPVKLDHIACIDGGELRYMSGRKAPAYDCELYAMPDGGRAPLLYAAAPQAPADVVRDVERYRWLRNPNNSEQFGIHDARVDECDGPFWLTGDAADAAIDAAMSTKAGGVK